MTQHKQSHRIKWHDQHIKWHDMTCHVATNHSSSPHVTSQPSTLLHLTPQATSWHQNRSHHHHGTAEGSFTAKRWFSIGKFFLWLIVFFLWNFRPRLVRALLVWDLYVGFYVTAFQLTEDQLPGANWWWWNHHPSHCYHSTSSQPIAFHAYQVSWTKIKRLFFLEAV